MRKDSVNSTSLALKVPVKKIELRGGKNVETESDIDGELVSKVSKAGLVGGATNPYPGEVY